MTQDRFTWELRSDGVIALSKDGSSYQIPMITVGTNYRDYKRALRYLPIIKRHCGALPEAWVIGIIFAENSGEKDVSNKGAVGLMQVLPDTAKSTSTHLMNVNFNIAAGCKFLRYLTGLAGGDLVAVASMYNAGMTDHGRPHPSAKSPFGFVESPFYILRVLSASNEYLLRPELVEAQL